MKQVSWVLALVVGVAIGFFAKSALVGGGVPSRAGLRPGGAAGPLNPGMSGGDRWTRKRKRHPSGAVSFFHLLLRQVLLVDGTGFEPVTPAV
mgnify:CR=1 FL=1